MGEKRRIVTVLMLFAIVLAFTAPALAQMQGMPRTAPAMLPERLQDSVMPVDQSDKDLMAALSDNKDTTIPASFMKTAGLESMTTPGEKYTLVVASDTALKILSPDTKSNVMKKLQHRQTAMEFVKGHLVNSMLTPDEMTDGMTLTMMNGDTMKVGRMDGRITFDDATVIKAIKTANGMIYVMDKIPSSKATMMERMGMLPASARSASL